MKFADIPQLTRMGSYEINVGWKYLEEQLEHYASDSRCKLELDPEFQRAHVWNEQKQRAYVEYILRGGHSSKVIYFNCAGWMKDFRGPMYLVDGKQRLEAVRKFMRNELTVFNGNYYKDFEDSLRLVGADFKFHVNDLPTYKAVLQWYLDLNAGGVIHTEEELNKVREMLKKEV